MRNRRFSPHLVFIPFFAVFLVSPFLIANVNAQEKDLPARYREFLDLTRYIILDEELEVFFKLDSDRDRDAFIVTFWKQRDPTPGTPRNEYQDEHLRRFNHANRILGRGTPRDGWQTDQGRIYIILGPPVSTDRFLGSSDVYPTEVWSYYGDESKGLPAHFSVVFYKRRGAGEFVIYNPAADGPGSLLVRNEGFDPANYEQLYRQIEEVAPTLAPVTLSMIPGEIPFDFHPSLETHEIMTSIFASPSRDVNVSYATHFLDYKGMVSTDYMTNYVGSAAHLAVLPDPALGLDFVHFAIVPERISVDYYDERDEYYCSFKLTVSLRDGDDIILQYSKDLPVYIPPDDLESVLAHGLSIEDSFPAAAGDHRLIVLVQNSVQKEFCLYEGDIRVPEASEEFRLYGPFVGSGFEEYAPDLHLPFKVGTRKLLVDPTQTLSPKDTLCLQAVLQNVTEPLWRGGRLEISIEGLKPQDPSRKSFSRNLRDMPFWKTLVYDTSIPARELSADYYEVRLSVISPEGSTVAQEEANVIVSPQAGLLHPLANAKAFPHANRFLYRYMLGSQYDKLENMELAGTHYEAGFGLWPEYERGIVDFARFCLRVGRFDRGLELIERLRGSEAFRFEYFLVKGLALQGKQEYSRAVESLLQANTVYNADSELLNALGFCYDKIGEPEKALEALRASLRMNPDQEGVKSLIAEIEKKK
jgi:GWxTD domain-containing protein